MHRTLFRVTWIKSKIFNTCCLRIYYCCKLSVCISSHLPLTFIFTQYNVLFILIYSGRCVSFPSSCPWLYHHSNICWKLQFMNHTLCNFGLPEWVTRDSQVIQTKVERMQVQSLYVNKVHTLFAFRGQKINFFDNVSPNHFTGFILGHLCVL